MKHKLSFKFIIVYLVVAASGFLAISTIGSYLVNKSLISSKSKSFYNVAQEIASEYDNYSSFSSESLYTNLCAIAKFENATIMLLDQNGTIYADTSKAYSNKHDEKVTNFDPVHLNNGYYTIGDFFNTFSEDNLSVIVPITSKIYIRGYITIHIPMRLLYEEREGILGIMHIVCIIIFCISLLILIMMNFWIYKPLNALIKGTKQFAAGNFNEKIEVKSNDEIGYLAETLNYMGSEINKTTEYQHKFISNVSHDFRSPLTSIKGYLQAFKDGIIPADMQEKYIDIIIAETERLNKLTSEMLSLDSIDNRVRRVNYTKFNINKLIKDTALSFEGTCINKGIKFVLLLEGDQLLVYADFGKIQQVMYNLIDNAIKFSNPNSSIDIETTLKKEKAYISVKDHGVGISNSEISKIWQRFYKTDSSRGKDRTGTGLGLSIVREIIKAHDQKITVVSTEGVGTEFTFTLDAVISDDIE